MGVTLCSVGEPSVWWGYPWFGLSILSVAGVLSVLFGYPCFVLVWFEYPQFGWSTLCFVGVPSVWQGYPRFGWGTLRLVGVPLVRWGYPKFGGVLSVWFGYP